MDREELEVVSVADVTLFRGDPIDRGDAERLASVLKAMADPVRLRIVSLLLSTKQRLCVSDLQAPLGLAQPTISHHLKIMLAAGLVTAEKVGLFTFYQVNDDTYDVIAGILTPPRRRNAKRTSR